MMRIKGLNRKLRLSRWAIFCLALVVALASVGVTYAGMKGPKPPDDNIFKVPSEQFSDPFTWVVSNDDGSANSVDPGDNGLDPNQPQTMGVALPPEGRYTENVASTTASLDDPYNITLTISNAYPCYYPTVFFGMINDGNRTSIIESIKIDEDFKGEDDVTAENITALDVTVGGISVGQMIDVGEEVVGKLAIHVEQDAEQDHVYNIRVRIVTIVECGPCAGQVSWLKLKYLYLGDKVADIEVVQRKGDVTVFDEEVQPGGEFDFSGLTKQLTFGPEISIYVDGDLNTKIHTSCSQPIGPGMIFGDFLIVAGESRIGGRLCPP